MSGRVWLGLGLATAMVYPQMWNFSCEELWKQLEVSLVMAVRNSLMLWENPNRKWMMTRGTLGYPYDSGNLQFSSILPSPRLCIHCGPSLRPFLQDLRVARRKDWRSWTCRDCPGSNSKAAHVLGGFHGGTPIAGWFISGKILSRNG